MARPPLNAIHMAEYQIKDFFIDESMKRQYPKNPYNVLWFINELLNKEEQQQPYWVKFKSFVLTSLANNKTIPHNMNPLKEKMIEDNLVIKRVKVIKEENNVDINSLNLATKAVRMMSVDLIIGLLELGLDPNIPDDKNLPLEVALNRKNLKIAHAYWNNNKINSLELNKYGENFAEIEIKYKQWVFFETILKEEPELIFGKNKNNELLIEKILKLFDNQKYIPTQYELEKINNGEKKYIVVVPTRIRKIIMDLMECFYQNNGELVFSNTEVKKLWIKKFNDILNEKYPEMGIKIKKNKI